MNKENNDNVYEVTKSKGKFKEKAAKDKSKTIVDDKKTKHKKKVSSSDEYSSSVSSNDSCFDKESCSSNTMEETETESDADSYISLTSTELLNNDPLYLVLSKFFVSKNGNNIADILEDLKKILK
jgi:hypothetical protein